MSDSWEYIRQFYMQKFDIDPLLVDVVSDFEILKLFTTGASNKSISTSLNLSEVVVSDTLSRYFRYGGWKEDLYRNPLSLYRKYREYKDFKRELNLDDDELNRIAYDSCSVLEEIEGIINENWV